MPRETPPQLPEVTDAHRREAFERMDWVGCTFEEAMANPVRARCVEARAHWLRTQQWQRERLLRYISHVVPSTPRHPQHLTARPLAFDGKRAAAGDLDD
jgi:hypothetical protein